MGKKRERVRQCRQIRLLIDEKKYTKALELIDELPLEEVGSLDDLYLFAELYEKAERMEKKKEIFYLIYNRTNSRYILSKLLRLTIRMGDMDEARELYFAYEVAGAVTLETFELRYLLAKAEGEPRKRLIEILEELKTEEYTEEWGLQLARLYEQEGEREKCIQECKRLKLWFGEGKLIEKAMELQKRCEAPDWEPPVEVEIPELEEPDPEEVVPYAAPPVDVTEIENEAEEETAATEEFTDQSDLAKNDAYSNQEAAFSESVSEPKVVKKADPAETPRRDVVLNKEELLEEEDEEDISQRGIHYRTLKSAINHMRCDEQMPHFVFAGGEERITLTVAKRITKELSHIGYISVRKIAKITAEKLNQIRLAEQAEKLSGGCMLVMGAPEMNKDAVEQLLEVMEQKDQEIIVMLAGPFDEMDCFLDIYPELAEKLTYKIRM